MASTAVFDKPKSQPLPDDQPLPFPRTNALLAVAAERDRQLALWGDQSEIADFMEGVPAHERYVLYQIPDEETAKMAVESVKAVGQVTWADILVAEVAEAISADDIDSLRAELVQVAAVAVAWVEALDERIARGES